MVEFRAVPVNDDDAVTLLTAYFDARAQSFPAGPDAYRIVFPIPAHFVPPRGVFVVMTEGGDAASTAIGCGGIRLLEHGPGVTRFEVKHLWVEPDARGRGCGTALLDELEARARAFGASEMVLDTNAAQEAATRLYLRSGYISIRPYNDNPNATHWFAKNLTTELE